MMTKLKRGEVVLLAVIIAGLATVAFVAYGLPHLQQSSTQTSASAETSSTLSASVSYADSDASSQTVDSSSTAESASTVTAEQTTESETTETDKQVAAAKAAYEAQYEETVAPYRTTVALGEAFALTNYEEAGVKIFVPWTGTLEVMIDDVALYDSLEDARASVELGTVYDGQETPPDGYANPRLLVMHVTVTNVDATPGLSVENPDEYFSIDAFCPKFYLNEGMRENGIASDAELATFDGTPDGVSTTSRDWNNFALAQGETRTLTIGWWVDVTLGAPEIVLNPSLSDAEGPITFDLGFGVSDGSAGGDDDVAA